MKKEPKPNWSSFTKAELVKTIKKLDARQTKLLNRIAELERVAAARSALRRPDLTEDNALRTAAAHRQAQETVAGAAASWVPPWKGE